MTLLTAIFDIIFYLINGLLSLVPVIALPTNVSGIFTWFFNLIYPGAYLVDMKSFFQCFVIFLVLYTLNLTITFFNYMVIHIPFLKIGAHR